MKPAEPRQRVSDGELLELARKGSEDAFIELYRRYQAVVFRFAMHMSGRREIAEDIVQEVFLTLLAPHCRYAAERGSLEGFLIGTARNQVRRHRREASRTGDTSGVEKTSGTPLGQELGDDDLKLLRDAILSLPERYRAVTVLCDLEERSYAEAAAQLGIAVGTLRSRLHRARTILESKLRRRDRCSV